MDSFLHKEFGLYIKNIKKPTCISIYIHVPFCISKCYYCSFYSVKTSNELIDLYIKNLQNEFKAKHELFANSKVTTIYIGGGNPTSIGYKAFSNLIETILSNVNLEHVSEFSIETNPETFTSDICEIIKNLPNLRLNIGFQRLDDAELEYIGRNSSVKSCISALEKALFITNNVGIDLMIGIPEFPNTLMPRLRGLLENYDIKHISTYFLTLEENTKYEKLVMTNQRKDPQDSEVNEYFEIIELLKKYKFRHYEISNFAKKGFACRHNLRYWFQKNYLGFGPSAVSTISNVRITNAADLENWFTEKNCSIEILDKKIQQEEFIMLRLRLVNRGFSIKEFRKRFKTVNKKLINCIKRKLNSSELIINTHKRIVIQKQNIIFSNRIISDLFESL